MKRMMRIIALLMAALMTVTSCQAPDSGSHLTDGTVDVSFAGPSARTITTDDGLVQTIPTSDLWFQYKAVWKGSGDPPSTATNGWIRLSGRGLTGTIKLHRGTWELSLRAFVNENDVGDDGKFILSGSLPRVEIGVNNMVTQTVSISLGYVRQEGNGTLHVSATYPIVYHEAANPGDSPVEAVRKVKVTANVAGTDYTGEIIAFDSNNVGTLDLTVPAGAAHVTVQYYMDDSTLFEDDQTAKDVLIMATMTTNLAVSVDRNITTITFKAEQPSGTVEDNLIKATSLFDIYPDEIADNAIVIGYAEETKALGDQTPITYPYISDLKVSKDDKGRYKASDLGLVPITVTTGAELASSGTTSAWWGKTATLGSDTTENTTLASVRFVDGVTEIKDFAFGLCTALTDIIIPDTVTSIGDYAFFFCTGLTSVTLPEGITSIGNYAFYLCIGPTNVTIPGSVTKIGNYAFAGCRSLTNVTIQEGVTEIGVNAFEACFALTSITLSSSITSIGAGAFQNCTGLTSITIPEGVTSIGDGTFFCCESLTNVTIPEGVTSVGDQAFDGCTNLTGITIPNSVTSIGISAFEGCSALTSITIPNSVTSIGEGAFNGCRRLISVTIPDNVTKIGNWTFADCSSLTSITIPSSVTEIGEGAFNDCTGLTSVAIPECVTSIKKQAFGSCTSLTSITIPANVTEIGTYAFEGCTGLSNVTIPSSVTIIGEKAFLGCTGLVEFNVEAENNNYVAVDGVLFLKDLTTLEVYPAGKTGEFSIPNGVTSIKSYAFWRCTGLTNVTIPSSVTSIGERAFEGCTSLTDIYINKSASSLFNNARVPNGCIIHWNSTGAGSV